MTTHLRIPRRTLLIGFFSRTANGFGKR